MFDIGWDEMALVAVLALVVIGPKELPLVLRQVGRWVKKGRSLAADFQRGVDDMVRDSEMADLRAEVERLTRPDTVTEQLKQTLDPDGKIAETLSPPDLARIDPPVSEPIPEPMGETGKVLAPNEEQRPSKP